MLREPIATYRVQLHPDFGFDQAADIVNYLAELGISHFYASPYLQAAAGSTHGYDVVDPTRVNEELGGSAGHARFCQALASAGLGQMIDIVPNHMAIAGKQNPWWWDVLENGPSSYYATYFDVDWEASEERWPNKVLLPVLGDHYGRILEAGELQLSHAEGVFVLHYYDHAFPVDPSSLAALLRRAAESCGSELLLFLADSHARLPRPTAAAPQAEKRRHREKLLLADLLARLCREEPVAANAIASEVERFNTSPDMLDALIDQQNYRLALWRTAGRDLGYRRFFDINDLAGLRVENEEVFRATHALPARWVHEGLVQGLRIDHPDGLRDPAGYFRRLREACPEAWIVAEKILETEEPLPAEWPIAGTSGYDFLNLAGGLFVDPAGEPELTRYYQEFTEETADFAALVRSCKRMVLTELLGSELNRLTSLFVDICERHRRHRDYTRHQLHEALRETAVGVPVYRTYVDAAQRTVSESDIHYVSYAIDQAMADRPDLDPELFVFLKEILLLQITGAREGELAMRFQQLTGAVAAKGVEDTAFYRFHRLVSLNEVGGDPSRFGVPTEHFHRSCAETQAQRPLAMLATSTHDTKRSEDVRTRLAVLSEIPQRWTEAVSRWSEHNARYRGNDMPDRNTEYLFYQTLVGVYQTSPAGDWQVDADRVTAYMAKAIREAKSHTSWTQQNPDYEACVEQFARAVMADEEFRRDFKGFVEPLVLPGRINSLAQTLIKLTAPGVPDIYQGSELWDLSLVDPDNRRPVDFTLRHNLLAEVPHLSAAQIMQEMNVGLPKLWLIRQALRQRQQRPELFGAKGSYQPLLGHGTKASHLVAFMRGDAAITLVPRLVLGLGGDWDDTVIELPEGRWHNLLTGEYFNGGQARVANLLEQFPVALLAKQEQ